MPCYDNIDNVGRQVSKMYTNIDGVLREVKKSYDNIDGVGREYFSGAMDWTLYQYLMIPHPSTSGYTNHTVTPEGYLYFHAYVNSNSSSEDASANAGIGMNIPITYGINLSVTIDGFSYSEPGATNVYVEFYRADNYRLVRWELAGYDGDDGWNYVQDVTHNNIVWNLNTPANSAYVLFYAGVWTRPGWNGGARMTVRSLRLNGVEQVLT